MDILAPKADVIPTSSTVAMSIRDLAVRFTLPEGTVRAVNGVSLELFRGETLGLVGESGSGKSITARTAMGLQPASADVIAGEVWLGQKNLLQLGDSELCAMRGRDIAMVFQNPMTSLDPVQPIASQIAEPLRPHRGFSRRAARAGAIECSTASASPRPGTRGDEYPHQWSGGMLQRASIAMAMAAEPKLLLADEPTTALDVTIQDQILALLIDLQRETNMALVLVSHDMGVIAESADRLAVMYAGRIVELGLTRDVFARPAHPYSRGLLDSIPRHDERVRRLRTIAGQPPDLARRLRRLLLRAPLRGRQGGLPADLPGAARGRARPPHALPPSGPPGGRGGAGGGMTARASLDIEAASRPSPQPARIAPLLAVENLTVEFEKPRGIVDVITRRPAAVLRAVDDVSLTIAPGETLGLVGESGSGKSTIARAVLRLYRPTAGRILHAGEDIASLDAACAPPVPALGAARFPGSLFVAQPAPHRRRGDRRGPPLSRHRSARSGRTRSPAAPVARRPRARDGGATAAATLRRTTPARRSGAGARRASEPSRARRAGRGARRVDPGAGPQPP